MYTTKIKHPMQSEKAKQVIGRYKYCHRNSMVRVAKSTTYLKRVLLPLKEKEQSF